MSTIKDLQANVVAFRDAREWKPHHFPKDMALSLVLEATEFLEHTQWKNGEELDAYIQEHKEELGDELADVLYWVLLIAHDLDIDLIEAHHRKLKKTAEKYPVEQARGRKDKYTAYRAP